MSVIDKELISVLKQKWDKCETESSEVFRYKLNVTDEKTLEGNFNFFVQVNIDEPIYE